MRSQHHCFPAPSQRAPQSLPSPRPGDPALPVVASTSALCTTLASRRHMPCHLSCGTHLKHVAQSWPRSTPTHAMQQPLRCNHLLKRSYTAAHSSSSLNAAPLLGYTNHYVSYHLSLPEQCEPAAEACKERNCQYGGSPPSTNHYVAVGLLVSTHY